MKDAMEVLLTRRSIRNFNDKSIPEDVLNKILEAGTYAPTAMGMQKPIIIAITDKKVRDEVSRENAKIMGREGTDPFYGAPVILLVAVENYPNAVYDGSCVMDNLLNAAWAMGVGSCWIHRAKEELESDFGKKLLKSLGIVGDYIGVGHAALGYFDGEPPLPKPRKENYIYRI
ncbi:MAG: nitroreductase [Clostridia bacterium]|nr:nitroreductase [Clostridia bacterium]